VIDALELRAHETVIDLGAGTGYFARRLRSRARLIAVDPVHCAHLRTRGIDAVERISEVETPVDLVFAANVLRFLTADDVVRIAELTPRIVLLDWMPGSRPVGPPQEDAQTMEDAVRAFPAFGTARVHDFLPYQWMIELRKT
jgi:hypothetical protein